MNSVEHETTTAKNGNKKAKIFVIGGPKGGTTKSTVAANLVVAAADQNLNVCLIDCDCDGDNGNQSSKKSSDRREVYVELCERLLNGEDKEQIFNEAQDKHLIIALKQFLKKNKKKAPSTWTSQLQNTDNAKMYALLTRMERDFDLIVVDTSGYSSLAFQSATTVADVVLVPLSNSIYEVERLPVVIDFLDQYEARANMNPNINHEVVIDCRVLLSKVEYQNKKEVLDLRNELLDSGYNVGMCEAMIPHSRKYVEASKWGLSPAEIGANSKFTAPFQLLLQELFGEREPYSKRLPESKLS